jgi:hypothetical protein
MAFLSQEEKKQHLEYFKGNLTGLSFSAVDEGYLNTKIQKFQDVSNQEIQKVKSFLDSKIEEVNLSVNGKIIAAAQNVSDLIYTHGNSTLQNAVNFIYSHGNNTLEAANKTITEHTEVKIQEVLNTIELEFRFTQDQIDLIRDAMQNAALKAASAGKTVACQLTGSLDGVAALEHQQFLTDCEQPANSYPVYETLMGKVGIVAYLANTVTCIGTGTSNEYKFEFKSLQDQCWVEEQL